MLRELIGLLGALLVLIFYAGSGRVLFIAHYRIVGFAVGFVAYVASGVAIGTPAAGREWIFDATHACLALAGAGALLRELKLGQQRRADAAYDPEGAAGWLAEGESLLRWFFSTDDLAALDRAVDLFRQGVRATVTHSSQFIQVNALQTALQARYERLRRLDDLDEAIDNGRRATASGYRGGVQRGIALSLLSTALRLRYDHVGAAGDLEEAQAACRTAIRLVPFRGRHFPRCSSEYSAVFQSEYQRTGQSRYLDLAIKWVRESVRSGRKRGLARPLDLTTLCALLAERGRRADNEQDLTDAVDAGRRALRRLPPEDRLFQLCQNNLAFALRTLFDVRDRSDSIGAEYELRPAIGHLDEAIRFAHRAAEAVPADAPQRADHRLNLALALHRRYRYELTRAGTPDPSDSSGGDLVLALEAARDAATNELADASTRIRAGLAWSDIAASTDRYAEAVTALEGVIELLPRIASRELLRDDQESRLGQWAGIAARAAACALAAGQEEKALVLLEQARGVLLSRALDVRADLTKLRALNPALATEFEELRSALDATSVPSAAADLTLDSLTGNSWDRGETVAERVPPDERARRMRRAQTARWDDLLARIRAEDGMAEFAGTPSLDRILAQAAAGPVVYLTVSERRSDAIILRPDGLTTVPLDITVEGVAEQTQKLQLALLPSHLTDVGHQQAVHEVLGWLWDDVVEPVLNAAAVLRTGSAAGLPRVWWIPTGALALLPIHAAGRHRETGSDTLLDRTISSYAPTVRALAAVRERRAVPAPARALVVAMSETPGAGPLESAQAEGDLVREFFADSTLLTNGEATRQRVLGELRDHSWVHFACHGVIDPDNPSRGRLLLHDHEQQPLTTADISGLELKSPALAYLSSCETARTSARYADEAIHLASAFQLAGFSDVIATLWKIPDRAAHEFTKDAYAELHRMLASGNPLDAAGAVREATLAARAKYPNLPGLWAGYIHLGG